MPWWILWNADNHEMKSVFLLLYWSYWTICSDLPGHETLRQRRYLQKCTLACCSGPSKSQQHTESSPLVSSQQNCHLQRGCCCQVLFTSTHIGCSLRFGIEVIPSSKHSIERSQISGAWRPLYSFPSPFGPVLRLWESQGGILGSAICITACAWLHHHFMN